MILARAHRGRPWSLLVVLALAATYVATASRYVLGGDTGEFVTVAFDGGVAHPPGYPLYILWLRLLSWIPASSPAHAASIATALAATLSLVVLSRSVVAWGGSEAGAALAVALYGGSGLAMSLATCPEVFAPNVALVFAIVLVAAPKGPVRGGLRTAALALLAGLALSNHHTAVLVAPLGLWGAWRGLRESDRRVRVALVAIALLGVGLAPYALLVRDARAAHPDGQVWGDVVDAPRLLHHFLRRDYGTFALSTSTGELRGAEQLRFLALDLLSQSEWLGVPLALVGAARLLLRRVPDRASVLALLSSALLVGPLLVLRFNLATTNLEGRMSERFHLLPLAFTALLAGLGASPWLARLPLGRVLRPALVALALVGGLARSLPNLAVEHAPTIQQYAEDILAVAPPGAVIFGRGDHRMHPILYAQRVLGERRDVVYINASMLAHPAYRRRLAERTDLGAPADLVRARAVFERARARGRTSLQTGLDVPELGSGLRVEPLGPVLRVVPASAPLPSAAELEQENLAAFERVHRSIPAPTETWADSARREYALSWFLVAEAYDREGDDASAARVGAHAAEYAPAE